MIREPLALVVFMEVQVCLVFVVVLALRHLWKNKRSQRRLAAEESERILAGEPRMETRTFLDPSTRAITQKQVPVGSPMLPGQQITCADFNRLDARIKKLENVMKRGYIRMQ